MASIVRLLQRKARAGTSLPRSIAIKQQKQKIIKRIEASRFTAVKQVDVYDDVPPEFMESLKRRSALREILFAEDILIVVSMSGLARAYHMHSTRLLCNLNPAPSHIVHTVVHNRFNKTIITAFEPHPGILQCKVIELQALLFGDMRPSRIAKEFESVVLHHPAFFEFDGPHTLRDRFNPQTNGRIGSANLSLELYTFWDMRTYTRVFDIGEEEFEEIRVSDGLVAMFKLPVTNGLPVSLFDIQNGTRLITDLCISTYPNRAVILLELCREHLLIKQEEASLHVYDLLRDKSSLVKGSHNFSPSCFIFLNVLSFHKDRSENVKLQSYIHEEAKHFLTVSDNMVDFWELSNCKINLCRRIDLPGVDSLSHVSYNLESNLLAVYTGGCSDYALYNEGQRDTSPTEYSFTSAREFFNYRVKSQLNGDLHTREGETTSEACSPGHKYPAASSKGIRDFEVLGDIATSQCGDNVKVLQCATDSHALATGCADGILRIIRIPTMYDDNTSSETPNCPTTSERRLAPFSSLASLARSMNSTLCYTPQSASPATTCGDTISPRSLLRSLNSSHSFDDYDCLDNTHDLVRGCKRSRDAPNGSEEPNEKSGRSD